MTAHENPKEAVIDRKKAGTRRSLGRVILVEDDPVQAMMLEDAFLRAKTREVVICATMQATMEALDKGRPDAIVIDVRLADRDDGWAIAEVVTLIGTNPPRIAFSTGFPQDIPPAIAQLGPVFEKPYDPEQLIEALASGRKPGLFTRLLG